MTANNMGNEFMLMYEAATLSNRQFNSREISVFLNIGQKIFMDTRIFPDMNTKGKGFEADAKRILDVAPLLANSMDIYLRDNGDFVRGTYKNGALRNSDKDIEGIINNSNSYGTVTDADDIKYATLIELKDEILYIVAENCDLSFGDGTDREWRYNVEVKHTTQAEYMNLVYNDLKNPYLDLVWRMEYGQSLPSSIVVAGRNTSEFRSTLASRTIPNESGKTLNTQWYFDGTRKRIVQLVAGKNWNVEKYSISYIREPREIKVDYNRPDQQVHCELHPHTHREVIEIAVRKACEATIPAIQKYQVSDKETKENE